MILVVFQFHPCREVGSGCRCIFILGIFLLDPELLSRLQYESPFYKVTLKNATLNDNGRFDCYIPPVGGDSMTTILERIQLHVFESM